MASSSLVLAQAADLYGALWPQAVGVLVGERNPTGEGAFPRSTRAGSWLRSALDDLGQPPLAIGNLWVPTVRWEDGEPEFRLNVELLALLRLTQGRALERVQVVALGRDVSQALTAQGIAHLTVCHPSWHRRFRKTEGVTGYARRLASALRLPAPKEEVVRE